jgi:hypothetical protein
MRNIFSPEQLDKVIKETIPAELPANHTNAIVGTVDKDGAKVAAHFAFKEDRWILEGAYQHDWHGDDRAGGRVIYSWGGQP